MEDAPALLDLGTARQIVQRHYGSDREVTACWQPPQGMYRAFDDVDEHRFYFSISERKTRHVGGTPHVAVDRRTGTIVDIGCIGE